MKLTWKLTTSAKEEGVSMSITREYTEWATFDDLIRVVTLDMYDAGEVLAGKRAEAKKKAGKK